MDELDVVTLCVRHLRVMCELVGADAVYCELPPACHGEPLHALQRVVAECARAPSATAAAATLIVRRAARNALLIDPVHTTATVSSKTARTTRLVLAALLMAVVLVVVMRHGARHAAGAGVVPHAPYAPIFR